MNIPVDPADNASDTGVTDEDLQRLTDQIVDAYLTRNPVDDPEKLVELRRGVRAALAECDRESRRVRRTRYGPSEPEYAW